jgi:hypothetical protein
MHVQVSPDNFERAESDRYFSATVATGGFGTFTHNRELVPLDQQTIVRMNRDTLYSAAVFDLDAGPVTLSLPDAGKRFMSMMILDEDQYIHEVVYEPGDYTLTNMMVGTRYAFVAIRILVDPADREDLARVHALQDAIKVGQPNPGRFEVPDWDDASRTKVRDALTALGQTLVDTRRMFGTRDNVDPLKHLIGTATGWGGNPERDAVYVAVFPENNDGEAIYRLTVRDVPVDGFWSISVYDAQGYFPLDPRGIYTVNNLTAKRNAGGSVTVQFGGRDDRVNCLSIVPGWNYLVRMYRPRAEILDGRWTFPKAKPVM